MKEFIIKPEHLSRIELWAATTIFVFSVFFLVTNMVGTNEYLYKEGTPFDYYSNYFFPQLIRFVVLFLIFLLLNFKVIPRLIAKERLALNITILVVVFLSLGLVIGIADTYSKAYLFKQYPAQQDFYDMIFLKSFIYALWVLLMFGIYAVVKNSSVYLLSNSGTITSKYRIITRDGLTAFVLWMISMFIMLLGDANGEAILAWSILGPSAIFFYCYSNYILLPAAFKTRKPLRTYFLKSLLILTIVFVPVAFIIVLVTQHADSALAGSFFNSVFHLFFTAPVSWLLFKRRLQGSEEVVVLQKELRRSNANLDFLRSQINPHFLFNALNTIYATSLNEQAERTSEAIQKLGDMMRFMLHENMQDSISLAREIEYMNNYIDLQKLRTDHNPSLKIETQVEEPTDQLAIAPMLLIPFVENAFKHGISFREPSQIRIALEVKNKSLYFDVYNSKHEKQENDPEKNSGIGLNNVKQRLQLLYPAKHELIIRETQREYFIHLTIQLS